MVITLDKHKKPLGFTSEAHARKLMEKGRACIYRYFPFIIIIKDVDVKEIENLPQFRIKIDPGSIHTGIAIVGLDDNKVYYYQQIEHRGSTVKENLNIRKNSRRNRRSRETGYRRPKWGNKTAKGGRKPKHDSPRPYGWLPPSVKSIADNILHWVEKLCRYVNITECSFEAVRFDSQLMDNPDIEGVEYQQGTLYGYEIRQYLLDKYQHTCQYCGGKTGDTVLEREHMVPVSRGGSDKVSNACIACHKCNSDKNNLTVKEWHDSIAAKTKKTTLDEARIKCLEKVMEGTIVGKSDRYSAWSNSMRRYVERGLFRQFGDVECSSGGRTKYNRTQLKLPKDHHYDALCVGSVPEKGYIDLTNGYVLYAKATGRGTRLRGQVNKCGIIIVKYKDNTKRRFGFQTGDIAQADKPKGKNAGHLVGKVTARADGRFVIKDIQFGKTEVNYMLCRLIQHFDGYEYKYEKPDYSSKAGMPIPHGNKLPCTLG